MNIYRYIIILADGTLRKEAITVQEISGFVQMKLLFYWSNTIEYQLFHVVQLSSLREKSHSIYTTEKSRELNFCNIKIDHEIQGWKRTEEGEEEAEVK